MSLGRKIRAMRKQLDFFKTSDQSKAPPLPLLVKGFLEYLKIEKNASDHTLSNYDRDLRYFFTFLFENTSAPLSMANFCDLKILRKFLSKESKQYQRASVLRRLSCIKSFLKFLHREGLIDKNIAKLIESPRPEEKIPRVLSPSEVEALIENIPALTLKQKRMKSVLELLYSTGIRISELVTLNREHLDFKRGFAKVLGKGNKERIVPLGRPCQTVLKDYIETMEKRYQTDKTSPLFLNKQGGRVSARTLQRDLKTFAIETLGNSGLSVTPHTLRHSCASHLLNFGAGLREIQMLLGHASLVTTQKYTHVDSSQLKAALQKAHPRENEREKDKETEK